MAMPLPEEFVSYTREMMGNDRFGRFLQAFEEEPPVSIRLNPMKTKGMSIADGEPVPWCREGYYLPRRPNFTMDPLLHAGCYYVQEAASMFVTHALRMLMPALFATPTDEGLVVPPLTLLDLCAAPGGKTTAAMSVLPEGSRVYANEPIRQRAAILKENVSKWGWPDCVVTNQYPKDYKKSKLKFDIVLCDVPCSGEGMFRKDEKAVGEWSMGNVERCRLLQRDIVSDAWHCLRDGGLLIYSTCTFNTKENEENVRWICEQFGAEVLAVETQHEWNITGSLLEGFDEPVYRFIPGISRSEGLFMAILRKAGGNGKDGITGANGTSGTKGTNRASGKTGKTGANGSDGTVEANHPCADLSYRQAIAYLRGESLTLADNVPRGMTEVTFQGHMLGMVKNIGTRANNLYPKEWRIRSTHIPDSYEPVIVSLGATNT